MSKSKAYTNIAGGGLSFSTVLFFIFLVLKLTGVIDWSWWYVTMPLYIPPLIGLLVIIFTLAIIWLSVILSGRTRKF